MREAGLLVAVVGLVAHGKGGISASAKRAGLGVAAKSRAQSRLAGMRSTAQKAAANNRVQRAAAIMERAGARNLTWDRKIQRSKKTQAAALGKYWQDTYGKRRGGKS